MREEEKRNRCRIGIAMPGGVHTACLSESIGKTMRSIVLKCRGRCAIPGGSSGMIPGNHPRRGAAPAWDECSANGPCPSTLQFSLALRFGHVNFNAAVAGTAGAIVVRSNRLI